LEHGVTSLEWHPDDERLLGRYLDRSAGDESLDRHLGHCTGCAARYRSLEHALEDTYQDVTSMADAEFPPARLAAQRRAILERLGQRQHGRVLPFPERTAPAILRARLAVAAALIAMTTTGLLRVLGGQPPAALRESGNTVSIATVAPQASARQEAVYLDIEMALARHGTAELQALDELTPRATGLVPAPR
jgi:anti-sigma factor RsiW